MIIAGWVIISWAIIGGNFVHFYFFEEPSDEGKWWNILDSFHQFQNELSYEKLCDVDCCYLS